jgi:hypothetical protein
MNIGTREYRQLEFMRKNKKMIVKTTIENKNTIGYVELYADDDFKLLNDKMRFVASDFNKKSFTLTNIPKTPKSIEIIEAEYIYYTVLWCDNKTQWKAKDLMLTGKY